MGGSSSSLLDDSKCTYIRGKTEAVIKNFSPHYKRQYAVSFCKYIQNELEQNRDLQSQFLKIKPPGSSSMVLYEGEVSHFAEDLKKWKERYIVIKNNYAVESFESKEAFQKGVSSKSCILPVGGKVLITGEEYNTLSDKHFPEPNGSSEKENTQAFVVPPKEFPVYLWQPFLRHSYYCFPDSEAQKKFSATLNDCIRHLNHAHFKQPSFESQAFLEAVQFFRQEKGHYGLSEIIIGNENQILSNLVMEELLSSLQSMVLPKMKGKRNERKRAWFGILEETYHLVHDQVSDGLRALKEECKEATRGLEGTIRSNIDQIVASKDFLATKIKGSITEPIQICCSESIQPFLASVLEELMGPVSSGFTEICLLFEKEVNAISQTFQATNDVATLNENVNRLTNLPYDSVKMEPCYLKVNFLQEQHQDLKTRFKFHNIDLVIQRTHNVMQEILENAVYTFEQLLGLNHSKDVTKTATAIEKVKLRVLKQYDYDSSTIRKRIFQDILIQVTLPTLQRTLASTCKPMLQEYEQYIFAEYNSLIQVENVYEEILFQTLLDESLKVIKEAVHLKKHNLYEEINLPSESVSSLSDLKTPVESAQASPVREPAPNLMDDSDACLESNEVFLAEKLRQEEECDEARKTKEEGVIISVFNGSESTPKILTVVEGALPITNVSESTMKQSKGTAEEPPVHDNVNEIRNLLTLTVELKEYEQSTNKEQDLQECRTSNSKEEAEDKSQEDYQTGDLQKPCSPTVKADDTNIVSSSGETSTIVHQDAPEKRDEQRPSDISREEPKEYEQSTNIEQDLQECRMSNPKEEEKRQEDHQTGDLQKPCSPTVKANIVSSFGETSTIIHRDAPEKRDEQRPSDISREELKEYEQSTNKEQDLQECRTSNSKEEAEDKSQEDYQTGDLQKPCSPTVKADDTNIVSSSGETSTIIHQDAPEKRDEQRPSDISREELKEYEQSTNKEQDLQECRTSNPKEEAEDKSQEDYQTGDLEKPCSPTVKADDTNIVSSSGETSTIIHQDAPEKCEEQSPSDISRGELNAEPNVAHPDEKNDVTYDQSQTEPSTESGQSDQSKIGPSPHNIVSEEQNSQTEYAEVQQPDQIREGFSSLHSFPKEDHSQMGQCIQADSQGAELSLLQSVLRETEMSPFLCCSVETQQSMLHTESSSTDSPPLLVSLDVKETEVNNMESVDSGNPTFDQRGDPGQGGNDKFLL
ncbi:protein Niban 1 isoform X2 [Thamnophis elegans]|uniref:protein Niban 1 isoform X2 n=1 Tax=Thamnophis elegans TaxID=35005 RepID=UPI0013770BBA|nr:protein Niban 1 isoform X2 [Thamnophis elegans]